MEKVFIQKIFQMTERILRYDMDNDEALRELHNHLAKARKLKMPLYEVEVLNTLGVLAVMKGELPESVQWWKQALEKTQTFDTPPFETQLKLLSNLSGTFIHLGDLKEATRHAERSLTLIEKYNIRNLSSLYGYNVAADCYMMQGRYAEARQVDTLFWRIAETVSLGSYSRFEYGQVVTTMQVLHTQLDLIARDEDAYQASFKRLTTLTEQSGREDFFSSLSVVQFYYALMIKQDEEAALRAEQEIIERMGGRILTSSLLMMAIFLSYNQQPIWAQKYAQQVIARADTEEIHASAVTRAQEILAL